MSVYVYPAILKHGNDGYYVNFPDIENCFTDGDTRNEAIAMAEDVLPLILCDYEDRNLTVPEPSERENISLSSDEEIVFIKADTTKYRNKYLKKLPIGNAVVIKKATSDNPIAIKGSAMIKGSVKRKIAEVTVNPSRIQQIASVKLGVDPALHGPASKAKGIKKAVDKQIVLKSLEKD